MCVYLLDHKKRWSFSSLPFFFSWVRRSIFFLKVTIRDFFGFILSCQQPPNASESVSFYTVIFICLFYIHHSITFPHLPTYSPVITNAPCGCLQGNFTLEKTLIALLFYFLLQLCIFFAVGLVTVTLAFWKLMNIHLKMNVQYLYIHFFKNMVCRKKECTKRSPSESMTVQACYCPLWCIQEHLQ